METMISKFKQIKVLHLFAIIIRYLLGGSFVHASIFKIRGIRFTPESGENSPIDTLPYFFEAMFQAGNYWQFLGWGQLIAGFLLMSQVFSTLGAVAFFPIMLNIFVITISFESTGILIITSLMLLGNIYLLLWDWDKLKFIVLPRPGNYIPVPQEFSDKKTWIYLGFVLCGLIIISRIL
ncbi:hypothetical protein [Aquiflexum gelatinilyticum]|uniref:DoxX family membrane protein n=1 Tax=Aquiflexum gelatinilyticum TaxID=2961943 RepID=A0A9X2P1K3_9BACT|nr:hypothetical protein [Aquiflexum gelatinilyticum]MCR9013571.1 hypothetical protein [Aquiflexum gelatinilyticum]